MQQKRITAAMIAPINPTLMTEPAMSEQLGGAEYIGLRLAEISQRERSVSLLFCSPNGSLDSEEA
jgi:hypothetical protein